MKLLEMIKMKKKESNDRSPLSVHWVETSDSASHHFQFQPDGQLFNIVGVLVAEEAFSIVVNIGLFIQFGDVGEGKMQKFGIINKLKWVTIIDDARPASRRMVESFWNKFFPSGYPYSVNEGYLRYTQFRALQHFSSATLSVLSTQGCLFSYLFPSSHFYLLQACDLRQHRLLLCQSMQILKDGMQHVGKLICSNLGARMDSERKSWRVLAGVLYDLGTGLEIISPLCPPLFLEMAGLGNFAKGMTVVAARATRLVVGPLLSLVRIYCVREEMQATPINTLNPQRTALIVAEFLKINFNLRHQEDLLFPGRLIVEAGSVKVGRPCHKDMILERNATGEDALMGWLVAAYAAEIENSFNEPSVNALLEAYERMANAFSPFISGLQAKGWHTDRFLDGTGYRFAF
ncbi:hypothetical protein OROGR_019475 [Orobanche gracilis]